MTDTSSMGLNSGTRYHLDRRADEIAAQGGDGSGDDLLTTKQLAAWFGVTESWVKRAKARGVGVTPIYVTPHCVRYKRSDALKFLADRAGRRFVTPTDG
jgi:hypothetical protein